MTSMSLFILEYPSVRSTEELEQPALDSPIFRSLSNYARECGPYRLQGWAIENGHEVFYIDNCWVRVPVSGPDLKKFLSEVLGFTNSDSDLFDKIIDDDQYLIEAEEF